MGLELVQDDKAGEFRRETGYGTIKEVVLEAGKRNAQVIVKAEHLNDPVQGWVDTTGDRDTYLAAVGAFDNGQRIFYRIETHRKGNVDVGIPFAELGKRDKVRDVREIVAVNGAGVPISGNEPPASGSPGMPVGAPVPDPAIPPQPGGHPPKAEPPTEEQPPPPDEAPPAGEQRRQRTARVEEGKPWQALNSDGSLNLGSYAVQAAEAMTLLAHDLLIARWRAGDAEAPPTEGQLRSLTKLLLLAADRAQAANRADGHADRMDNSHTRARAAVRAGLEVHPVPFGADQDARTAWVDALSEYASSFLATVLTLVDREVP